MMVLSLSSLLLSSQPVAPRCSMETGHRKFSGGAGGEDFANGHG